MTYDSIVVLGASVKPGPVPSEALLRRMRRALEAYRERPALIVCCGAMGADEPMAEGDFMCAWMQEQGVPAHHLLSEDKSFDTVDNLRNARDLLRARGLNSPLVVTSDYHLRRALAIARRLKLDASGAGSPSVKSHWLHNNGRELLAWGKFILRLRDMR